MVITCHTFSDVLEIQFYQNVIHKHTDLHTD